MKKVILMFSLAILMSGILNAQEETNHLLVSKKGFKILPEKGDIALGIDASPILNFAGNMFNGNIGNSTAFDFTNSDNAIYGKYFLDDKTAVRVNFRIGMGTITDVQFTPEDNADPNYVGNVEDKMSLNTNNTLIGIGYEKRRGNGRLQGFYGGEFLLGMSTQKTTYEYGNEHTGVFTTPGTTDFGDALATPIIPSNIAGNARLTEAKSGANMRIGLGAFVGVEYFLAPKISIGGQFSWGAMFYSVGEGETTTEEWDNANGKVETTTTKSAPGYGGGWGIDTGNASGSIFMLFHF
jgi:hypothetical protein